MHESHNRMSDPNSAHGGGQASGLPAPGTGKYGTVLIANDNFPVGQWDMSLEMNPRSAYLRYEGIYAHEVGNLMAYWITKKAGSVDYFKYGDKNSDFDKDSGYAFEKCMFP